MINAGSSMRCRIIVALPDHGCDAARRNTRQHRNTNIKAAPQYQYQGSTAIPISRQHRNTNIKAAPQYQTRGAALILHGIASIPQWPAITDSLLPPLTRYCHH
jgi:hypothetical protein